MNESETAKTSGHLNANTSFRIYIYIFIFFCCTPHLVERAPEYVRGAVDLVPPVVLQLGPGRLQTGGRQDVPVLKQLKCWGKC